MLLMQLMGTRRVDLLFCSHPAQLLARRCNDLLHVSWEEVAGLIVLRGPHRVQWGEGFQVCMCHSVGG